MRPSDLHELRENVRHCAVDVLASYELFVDASSNEMPKIQGPTAIASFMGFGGELMRGTLTIVAQASTVERSYPVPGHTPAMDELFDWWGEVANQLCGRIKNKLLLRGIEIQQSTPQSVLAVQLRIARSDQSVCALDLRCGGDSIGIWFDCATEEGVSLFSPPRVSMQAPAITEGDLLLF